MMSHRTLAGMKNKFYHLSSSSDNHMTSVEAYHSTLSPHHLDFSRTKLIGTERFVAQISLFLSACNK